MKGRKGSTDEGGVRSPLLIRWPKYIEAGKRIVPIAAAIDLLPTLADLAEIEVTSTRPLDGVSLKGNLVDSSQSAIRSNHDQKIVDDRMIFSHWAGRVSVRTQQYRLDHQGKLYDMQSDPGQHVDISKQQPKQAAHLQQSIERWKQELLPQRNKEKRPFIIGHPDCRMTQLPARDGIGHGDIKRSCRHPNCSFFTNWTSLEDRITWNLDVGVGGEYEVELYYTCPQVDVGSTFELSFQSSRLRGKIHEGHNPPLQGQQYDRVPRAESYVKDFKPLKLGTIQLPQGKGELSLRALDIPGSQVMDFRLLMFTRISDRN
jgi:hypothetical protein